MAKHEGVLELSGKLGDLIFYGNGRTRSKSKKPHNLSEESKKTAHDFGQASRNAAYIRKAFAPMVTAFPSKKLISRLNKCLIDIFKTIPSTEKGNKKLIDGNLNLLQNFEFNEYTPLNKLLLKELSILITQDGLLKLSLAKSEMNTFVENASNEPSIFIKLMAFNFDLIGDSYEIFEADDLELDLNDNLFPGANLTITTNQQGEKALIITIGVYYGSTNSRSWNRQYFACKIAQAMHLKDGVPVHFIKPVVQINTMTKKESSLTWTINKV